MTKSIIIIIIFFITNLELFMNNKDENKFNEDNNKSKLI